MATVKSWRVIYADGTEFTSDDGRPEHAPGDGVFLIMEYPDAGGRRLVQGGDYYFWMGEQWTTGDRADLERWMRAYPDATLSRLKRGVYGNDAHYNEAVDRVMRRAD